MSVQPFAVWLTVSGVATPTREVKSRSAGGVLLNSNFGLALDATNNEIFAADLQSKTIVVYSRAGHENIVPTRTLVGASTTLVGSL